MTHILRLLAAPAAVIAATACLLAGHPASTSGGTTCPPKQSAAHCVKGAVIFWEDPAHPSVNQFIQEDNSGAPQFWVGVGGAASGANPFCVTDRTVVRLVACIGGPWSNGQGEPEVILYDAAGNPYILTIADLQWLHRAEKIRPGW